MSNKPLRNSESSHCESSGDLLKEQTGPWWMEFLWENSACGHYDWSSLVLVHFLFPFHYVCYTHKGARWSFPPVLSLTYGRYQRENHEHRIQVYLPPFYWPQWNATENSDITMAANFPFNFLLARAVTWSYWMTSNHSPWNFVHHKACHMVAWQIF